MKILSTLLIIVLFSFASLAQSTTWIGAIDDNWNTVGNWDAGIPDLLTTVSIFSSPNDPVIAGAALAQQVIVSPGASLTILSGGELTIDKFGSTDMLPGLLLNDDFINEGDLNIDNAFNGILINSAGTITNSGNINIGLLGPIESNGLYNDGEVVNNAIGEITVDDANVGLTNFNGEFTNLGELRIGETIGMDLDGVRNYDLMENSGQLEIFNVAGTGFRNYNSGPFYGTFINYQAGFVEIGICHRGVRNESTLSNFGEMYIGSVGNVGLFAIDNRVDGILENNECALMVCNDKLENSSSNPIENDGSFVLDSPTGSNVGLFNNNGIVSDLNNTFPTASNGYTNNGFYLASVTINSCITNSVFSIGGSGNYTVEGVYFDLAGTSVAGLYDAAANTYTNYATTGMHTLYVKFENLAGNCSIMVPWFVDVLFSDTITFNGNGDGVDWHDPLNWDLGIVPNSCHLVVIPAPHNVVIAPNAIGIGKALCVDLNASLDVPALAELEILIN